MADDWDLQPDAKDIKKAEAEVAKPKEIKDDDVKSWFTEYREESKVCTLIYGTDGTMKSGLALSYIDLMPEDQKMMVIDLDGGDLPIIMKYYKDRMDRFIHLGPVTQDGENIDYLETFKKIRKTIEYVRRNYEKEKIGCIVFDGLSTALSYAEQQMRIDKNITPDGGVTMAYWKIRNKHFLETLEQVKSIPIARIFISHEDFIGSDTELSSAKLKTNQMMFQKIKAVRKKEFGGITFTATIDKSKYEILLEGKTYDMAKVDKDKGEYTFNASEVWKDLVK